MMASEESFVTKEEKEQLLNRKIEEIRRKNEETMKKYKMKEHDKQMAEMSGRSVTLHLSNAVIKKDKPEIPQTCEVMEFDSSTAKHVEKVSPKRTERQISSSKESRTKNTADSSGSQQQQHPKSSGMTRKSDLLSEGPPPDPAYNFLADDSRDGPLPDARPTTDNSRRHPRNFGGSRFEGVTQKMQQEREQQYRNPGPRCPQSKIDYQLSMTGKERLDYAKWKAEQDKIDRERLERHKNAATGEWRREWDREKVQFEEEEFAVAKPPTFQRLQPGVRQAGRIGSGRFAVSEGSIGPSKDQHSLGRGRGRNREQQNLSQNPGKSPTQKSVVSNGNASRCVEALDDTLIVRIGRRRMAPGRNSDSTITSNENVNTLRRNSNDDGLLSRKCEKPQKTGSSTEQNKRTVSLCTREEIPRHASHNNNLSQGRFVARDNWRQKQSRPKRNGGVGRVEETENGKRESKGAFSSSATADDISKGAETQPNNEEHTNQQESVMADNSPKSLSIENPPAASDAVCDSSESAELQQQLLDGDDEWEDVEEEEEEEDVDENEEVFEELESDAVGADRITDAQLVRLNISPKSVPDNAASADCSGWGDEMEHATRIPVEASKCAGCSDRDY